MADRPAKKTAARKSSSARPAPAKRAPAKSSAAKRSAAKRSAAKDPDVHLPRTKAGLLEPSAATEFPTPLAGGVARGTFWPPAIYWMKVTAAVFTVYLLYRAMGRVQNVLVLLLISMVLALGLQPGIKALVKRGMKRGPAVAVILISFIAVIGAFLGLMVPVIVREVGNLIHKAPDYLREAKGSNNFIGRLDAQFDLQGKLKSLGKDAPKTALGLIKSFTALIFNTLTVLILTAIIAVRLPSMKRGIARVLRRQQREDFEEILDESIDRVGGYVVGNIVVSLFAGAFAFVLLLVLHVPYGAALAFWVAIADLIPTIGAILGMVVCVAVAAFVSVPVVIATFVGFVIYQQVENYVIAPRVMKRAIDMSPGAVIVAVLIGGSLAGFVGGLIALPVAAIIKIAIGELYLEERLQAVREADAAS